MANDVDGVVGRDREARARRVRCAIQRNNGPATIPQSNARVDTLGITITIRVGLVLCLRGLNINRDTVEPWAWRRGINQFVRGHRETGGVASDERIGWICRSVIHPER